MKKRILILALITAFILMMFALVACSGGSLCVDHRWETYKVIDGNIQTEICANCGTTRRLCYPFPHTFTYSDNKDGTHTVFCSKCGISEAVEHTLVEVERVESTCESEGYVKYECECSFVKKETLSKIDHTFSGEWAIAEEGGYCVVKCDNCEHTDTHTCDPDADDENGDLYCDVCNFYICDVIGHIDTDEWHDYRCDRTTADGIECGLSSCIEHVFGGSAGTHVIGTLMHGDTCRNCGDAIGFYECDWIYMEPTCTKEGGTRILCEFSDGQWLDVVPALGHIDDNEDGICERCDRCIGQHIDEDTDNVCDNCDGCVHANAYILQAYDQHYMYCEDCGEGFDYEGHDLTPAIDNATCFDSGYAYVCCTICGWHDDYSVIEGPLVCEDADNDLYCDNCGMSICEEHNIIPSNAFSYDTFHSYYCDVCGHIIEHEDHIWGEIEYGQATCYSAWNTTRRCTICGILDTTDWLDFQECQEGDVIDYRCCWCGRSLCAHYDAENGVMVYDCVDEDEDYYCDNCGDCLCETIYDGHNFTIAFDDDYHFEQCTRCGCIDEYGIVEEHMYTTPGKVEENGVNKDGYTVYYCCGCDYKEIIIREGEESTCSAGEHNWQLSETIDPICVEMGYSIYTCSNCGEEYIKDWVVETGIHIYVLYDNIPSSESPCCGDNYYRCIECNVDEYSEYYENHNYDEGVRLPIICQSYPRVLYTCLNDGCGHTYIEQLYDEEWISHDFDEGVYHPISCDEFAYTEYHCQREGCTDPIYREYDWDVEPQGHKRAEGDGVYTSPEECESYGYWTYTCEVCGEPDLIDINYDDYRDHVHADDCNCGDVERPESCCETVLVVHKCEHGDTYDEYLTGENHSWIVAGSEDGQYHCLECYDCGDYRYELHIDENGDYICDKCYGDIYEEY